MTSTASTRRRSALLFSKASFTFRLGISTSYRLLTMPESMTGDKMEVKIKDQPGMRIDIGNRAVALHNAFYRRLPSLILKGLQTTADLQRLRPQDVGRRPGRTGPNCALMVVLVAGCDSPPPLHQSHRSTAKNEPDAVLPLGAAERPAPRL